MTKINKLHFNWVDYDIGDKDIHDLTEKTAVDWSDEIVIADSEDSYASKKIKQTNLIGARFYQMPSTWGVQQYSDNPTQFACYLSNIIKKTNVFWNTLKENWTTQQVGTNWALIYSQGAYWIVIKWGYIYANCVVRSGSAGAYYFTWNIFKCKYTDNIADTNNWTLLKTLPSIWPVNWTINDCLIWHDWEYFCIMTTEQTQAPQIKRFDNNFDYIDTLSFTTKANVQWGNQHSVVWKWKYVFVDNNRKLVAIKDKDNNTLYGVDRETSGGIGNSEEQFTIMQDRIYFGGCWTNTSNPMIFRLLF